MGQASKLQKSRDSWKVKAISRGKEVRKLRKQLAYYNGAKNKLIEELNKKSEVSLPISPPTMSKLDLIFVAVTLFVHVGLSFRGIANTLKVLKEHLNLKKAPSHQTVINWVERYSIVAMKKASNFIGPQILSIPFCNGLVWMVDISIGLGQEKILTVLGVKIDHHLHNEAITHRDVYCMGVAVKKSWTGELIADFLKKLIGICGRPAAYLKDGGTDIKKSVDLLTEQNFGSFVIQDVSHYCANLLKHFYEEHPLFQEFLTLCGTISKKFKQSILACMAPPTTSHKARFMNVGILFKWAQRLLKHSIVGRAKEGSLLETFREKIGTLPQLKGFIECFVRDEGALRACQKILKKSGLNETVYLECKEILSAIPPTSSIYQGMVLWLDDHLELVKRIGTEHIGGLPTSTDVLESLFGRGKKRGVGSTVDATRIALRLPTLTGYFSKEDAIEVSKISVCEQKSIYKNNQSIESLRRESKINPDFLNKLEEIKDDGGYELIPKFQGKSKLEDIAVGSVLVGSFTKDGPRKNGVSDPKLGSQKMGIAA